MSRTLPEYDILVVGGTLYDGTLDPPYKCDMGIKGDQIIALGDLGRSAKSIIDATGYIVTPGFIDCHNHTDVGWKMAEKAGLLNQPLADWKENYNFTSQGVSTIVTGNCGMGYTDVTAWFNAIKSVGGFGTNIYHLIPYEAIKLEVVGSDQRPATAREIELINKRVEEEMQNGAAGFSTGLELAPAVYDSTDELVKVAKVVKKYNGIYATHLRSESGTRLNDGKIAVFEAIKEAIEIGRRSGIPVQISHLKINLVPADPREIIELVEAARKEGIDVTADQYPYDSGMQRIVVRLDTKFRTGELVRDEFKSTQGREELKKGVESALAITGPGSIEIVSCDANKDYEGRNLEQIARSEGRSAADVFTELSCLERPPFCIFFTQNMDVVRRLMTQEWVFTSSDASMLPQSMVHILGKFHPRFYGNFPRKIRQFALDEHLIDLQFAVRSMTSLPAKKFGLINRGRIAVNHFADIAIIDIAKFTDKATYENPAQYSDGLVGLIVNGIVEIQKGTMTGDIGGRPCSK